MDSGAESALLVGIVGRGAECAEALFFLKAHAHEIHDRVIGMFLFKFVVVLMVRWLSGL